VMLSMNFLKTDFFSNKAMYVISFNLVQHLLLKAVGVEFITQLK